MKATEEEKFLVFKGQVVIIRPTTGTGIMALTDRIIELTTGQHAGENDICLFIDLSLYSAVTSTFFGTLGATIQIPFIRMVGLCGMKGHTLRTAARFGIVDGKVELSGATAEIVDNGKKFRIFSSIEEGVLNLVPKQGY